MAHKKTFISALALVMFLLPACGSDKDEFPTGQWTTTDPIEGVLMIDYRDDGTWSGQPRRSRMLAVMRSIWGSRPARPWAQSVQPEVTTVPPPGEV
jgi:hypothetical protein